MSSQNLPTTCVFSREDTLDLTKLLATVVKELPITHQQKQLAIKLLVKLDISQYSSSQNKTDLLSIQSAQWPTYNSSNYRSKLIIADFEAHSLYLLLLALQTHTPNYVDAESAKWFCEHLAYYLERSTDDLEMEEPNYLIYPKKENSH